MSSQTKQFEIDVAQMYLEQMRRDCGLGYVSEIRVQQAKEDLARVMDATK